MCRGEVEVPGMTVMKDVAIAKSEFMQGEKAISKIQHFHLDPVFFEYCSLPEVPMPPWLLFSLPRCDANKSVTAIDSL